MFALIYINIRINEEEKIEKKDRKIEEKHF